MGKKQKNMDDFLMNLGLGIDSEEPKEEIIEEPVNVSEEVEEVDETIETPVTDSLFSDFYNLKPDYKEEEFELEYEDEEPVEEEEDYSHYVKEELKEEIKEENNEKELLGGSNMEDTRSLTEVILNSTGFKKYEKSINGEMVRSLISNKLIQNVQLMKMSRQEFHEKFLSNNVELTNVEKDEFIKEFYPSAVNGSSVEYIMTVDIPVSVLEGDSPLKDNKKPLFWKTNSADIKKYTSQHPEIFGSRNLNPVLLITNSHGEKVYRLFISTLYALLYAEGLSVEKLKESNIKVSITNIMTAVGKIQTGTKDPIQTGLNNGTITFTDDYVLQYVKF